jgi:hypothetical protein
VAEVGDAVGRVSWRFVGGVVHGRLENGFAVREYVTNRRKFRNGRGILLASGLNGGWDFG